MPKIPTYKATGQITNQAPSIQTGLQISPTATAAAKLIKPLTQVAEYYERERMIAEKTDAEKQYLELSTELDEIENNAGKLFDPLEASKIFNTQANFLIKEKLGQNKNKRVKKMMSDLFDQDVIIRNNNVKKLARKELDKQEEYNFNTKYEINLSKYKLATNQTEKDFYKNQIFSNQESRSLYFNDSESTKNIAMDSINKDLLVSDVEQLIEKKQYDKAKNILENVDNTPYLDSDKRTSLLSKINDEYEKVLADANIDNLILSKSGVYVVGGELKNIDGSQIKQKDLESGMNRMTMAVNEQGNNKYSTSQVVELSIANNAAVPFYKSILVSGIANISDTGDKTLTEKGLEIYRFYKNQNGLSTLRATYNLDKETLESYSRLDFATNVLKQTFDSAFKTELDIKNKPEDYRARIIQDKKIDSKFAEIDMPGLFDPEIQNVQTVKYLLKNIANIYFKSGGTEDDALDGAVKYIEQNYRFDSFNQIVPNDNSLPEYHDASIKTYIKKIYDEGLINKEKHNLDDIYPAYFSYGDFSNQQGFVLRNRKTGEALTISASPPLGDFDERTYNSSRMTQDDVVKIIYPLIQDEKYRSWILKFNLLKNKRKKIQNLKEPVVVSGFGDPID